jgi:hypothetical protein
MTAVRRSRLAAFLSRAMPFAVVPVALVACASKNPAPAGAAMPPIEASKEGSALSSAGLDPKNLPALDKLGKDNLKPVMHSFADSLGVQCSECHAPAMKTGPSATAPAPGPAMGMGDMGGMKSSPYDFDVWTPNKRIAAKMWSEFVQKLSFANGDPLYCDSCHQQRAKFLDRSDDDKLGQWMHDNFVAKLVQKNGQPVECATCHGKPFNGSFLDGWALEQPTATAKE